MRQSFLSADAGETEAAPTRGEKLAEKLEKKGEDFLSIFGNFTDTAKPFFKERWPRDAVK